MLQYKTIHVVRMAEEKQISEKNGRKTEKKNVTVYENWANFHARYEKILNDMALQGWVVVSMQYNVPITQGFQTAFSDYGKAEIFTLMAKEGGFQ